MTPLSEIEEIIENESEPLRFKGFYKSKLKNKSLGTFIELLLTSYSKKYITINANNRKEQCSPRSHRRSLGDIYSICKYYYPKCTLKKVIKELFSLVGEVQGFRYTYCSIHSKKMFYYNEYKSAFAEKNSKDEYQNKYKDYIEILNN